MTIGVPYESLSRNVSLNAPQRASSDSYDCRQNRFTSHAAAMPGEIQSHDADEAEFHSGAEDEEEDDDDDVDKYIPVTDTFVRHAAPHELLGSTDKRRVQGVQLELQLQSATHVGGGRVRGTLVIQYNEKAKKHKLTSVTGIKLDCIGCEAGKSVPQHLFFNVAQDIITESVTLAELEQRFKGDQPAARGSVSIPFALQLPLDVGPGHFAEADNKITYTLYCTVLLAHPKRFPKGKYLRAVRNVRIYPMLDASKVFVPSHAPMQVVEDEKVRFGGGDTLKLAARLHRATCIAGQRAQVEVSVNNDTRRDVKRIVAKLVRHIVTYKYAAASAGHQQVDGRVPDKIDTTIICTNLLERHSDKSDDEKWAGVSAKSHATVLRYIDIPDNQLSIGAGRHFEVRYVLSITAQTGGGSATVEMPLTIISMHSVDIMPNELGTVMRMVAAYQLDDAPLRPSTSRRASRASSVASIPSVRYSFDGRNDEAGGESQPPPIPRKAPSRQSSRQTLRDGESRRTASADLRRALSLDYHHRLNILSISPENVRVSSPIQLQRKGSDHRSYHGSENLARRLHRENSECPNFSDLL